MFKTRLIVFAVALGAAGAAVAAETRVSVVDRPDTSERNEFYVGNRGPLLPSPFIKLPIGAVAPRGWARKQLELEAAGFVGRLSELSGFLEKENNAWLSPEGEGEHFWEEVPYWLKGYTALGCVLDDETIIMESRRWIEAVLASQRDDGWFGPRANLRSPRGPSQGKPDLWPNMIMLNVLQSHHEYSGDERVLDLMTKYFRWELDVPAEDFLPPFWQQQRAGDNLASVYWLYNRTGDRWLLELAEKIHRHTAPWTDEVASWHGVNISQCFRQPATFYMQSKAGKHLQATERNYSEVMSGFGQVPGGMFGADENCRPGFTGPRQAAETCSMVEMMLSHETLLRITGQAKWADRCEEVAFNSLPASMTPDLKALHYLTAPNMVLCDAANKSPGVQNRGPMLLFDPRSHRCCQHNVAHGWPYFVENLWQATPGNGLAAALYAPCEVTAKVGDGAEVTIAEKTRYPFDDSIELLVSTAQPVSFPLYLRVPQWCDAATLRVNAEDHPLEEAAGRYVRVERRWSDGDRVALTLRMQVKVTRWTANKNSVSVRRGPLTYSLKIGEQYVRVGGDDRWPALEVRPTTPWNYGLVLDDRRPAASFEAVEREWPKSGQPFEAESAPIALRAKAKRIPAWKMDYLGLVGPLNPSPVRSDEPIETITLIPMGCARLRISAFPVIGDGADAHEWSEPRTSLPASASHVWRGDTVAALDDGLLPSSSGDPGIPRFTWWDHRGTSEWVAYDFEQPRTISRVEVYWFDDTGRGHCRTPLSWQAQWADGEKWLPVETRGEYGVRRDQFNSIDFEPVATRKVRLVVQLQPEFSAGILEWRVK